MQKAIAKINKFFRDNHRMPTYSELMEMFSYRSKSAVHYFINKLIDAGYFSKDKKGHLIPRKLFSGIKLLGLVEAGFPSQSEEELVDTMNLEEYLITNKEASKKSAIEYIQQKLSITKEETMGIGDMLNDLPLFEASGLKVAMGNGDQLLKDKADYVAPSIDEDGVAVAIEKYW